MAGTATKYSYPELEAEYVASDDLSVRALALKHDLNPNALHVQARKKDASGKNWYEKRAERQARGSDKLMTQLATRDVERRLKEVETHDAAIGLIRKAISKMDAQLDESHFVREKDADGDDIWVERPRNPVTPQWMNDLIDRLGQLFGKPIVIPEGHANVSLTADADSPTGRAAILELARHLGGGPPKVVGGGPGRDPEGGGPVPRPD